MQESGSAVNGEVEIFWTRSPGRAPTTPLLLISGLGSPLVSFEEGFVEALNQLGFDVVRFDNRDVGRSSRVEEPYGVSDMARDAVAVLDAVGWDQAIVTGQSMGGMIAQQIAIDSPNRVRALVSIMSSSGERDIGSPTSEALEALLAPAPASDDAWLEQRVASERVWASPELWDEAWVRAKGQALLAHGIDRAGTVRQYRAIVSSGSRAEELATLATPTVVLHGSADTLLQPAAGRRVAELVPDAVYVEIEGMGHDLPPALWPRLAEEIAAVVAITASPDAGR